MNVQLFVYIETTTTKAAGLTTLYPSRPGRPMPEKKLVVFMGII